MRVAHFVQRYPPALGGSEAYFARLSRYLAGAGTPVSVFTTTALDLNAFWSTQGRSLPAGTFEEEGVQVARYPLWRMPGRRYVLKASSFFPHPVWQCLTLPCNPISWQMWADAGRAEQAFDVVHATAFPYAWPIACGLRLARRLGVPFVLTPFLHLGDPDDPHDAGRRAYLSRALRYLLRAADRVIVQTSIERSAVLAQGIPSEMVLLQGLGVDPMECTGGNRNDVRREWGLEADDVVVGHLANNSVEKGTVDLLRAADLAWHSGRQFQVVLAGPEMPNFRQFWTQYPLAARVRRLGALTDAQRKDFFAGIDVFALPSRSDSFGLVLLEAWANGIPNLAYRAGGVAEVIRHDEDGILVPCGNVEQLAQSLGHLVSDREIRHRLGVAGRERTQAEFRWPPKLQLISDTYQELVTR
jgi:glycosyltransferase involved in cell wall biosynthesis